MFRIEHQPASSCCSLKARQGGPSPCCTAQAVAPAHQAILQVEVLSKLWIAKALHLTDFFLFVSPHATAGCARKEADSYLVSDNIYHGSGCSEEVQAVGGMSTDPKLLQKHATVLRPPCTASGICATSPMTPSMSHSCSNSYFCAWRERERVI